jgi:hypothetical protein
MTQRQIDQQMLRIQQAAANGKITQAEFEGHLEALRTVLRESPTDRALRLISEALDGKAAA